MLSSIVPLRALTVPTSLCRVKYFIFAWSSASTEPAAQTRPWRHLSSVSETFCIDSKAINFLNDVIICWSFFLFFFFCTLKVEGFILDQSRPLYVQIAQMHCLQISYKSNWATGIRHGMPNECFCSLSCVRSSCPSCADWKSYARATQE